MQRRGLRGARESLIVPPGHIEENEEKICAERIEPRKGRRKGPPTSRVHTTSVEAPQVGRKDRQPLDITRAAAKLGRPGGRDVSRWRRLD